MHAEQTQQDGVRVGVVPALPRSEVWITPLTVAVNTRGSEVGVKTKVIPALARIAPMRGSGLSAAFGRAALKVNATQANASTARFRRVTVFMFIFLSVLGSEGPDVVPVDQICGS